MSIHLRKRKQRERQKTLCTAKYKDADLNGQKDALEIM